MLKFAVKSFITHHVWKAQLAANYLKHSAIHVTRTYYTPDSRITDLYTAGVGQIGTNKSHCDVCN